ncbi:hypothetical protein AAULR_15173, partial [Lacticaseibacillus rhamnosus MTCC 5462]
AKDAIAKAQDADGVIQAEKQALKPLTMRISQAPF